MSYKEFFDTQEGLTDNKLDAKSKGTLVNDLSTAYPVKTPVKVSSALKS
jgi:hypothetical protein